MIDPTNLVVDATGGNLGRGWMGLRRNGRAAFIPFITAGDPDADTSFAILEKLAAAGADLIELGVPFSDPMADGPANQRAAARILQGTHGLPGGRCFTCPRRALATAYGVLRTASLSRS